MDPKLIIGGGFLVGALLLSTKKTEDTSTIPSFAGDNSGVFGSSPSDSSAWDMQAGNTPAAIFNLPAVPSPEQQTKKAVSTGVNYPSSPSSSSPFQSFVDQLNSIAGANVYNTTDTGVGINPNLPAGSIGAAQSRLDSAVTSNSSLMSLAPYSATSGGVGFGALETKKTAAPSSGVTFPVGSPFNPAPTSGISPGPAQNYTKAAPVYSYSPGYTSTASSPFSGPAPKQSTPAPAPATSTKKSTAASFSAPSTSRITTGLFA